MTLVPGPVNLIELNDVCLNRNGFCILNHLTLTIPLGQHTVVLGPNGSGKTSLLKLLMRFFYPSVVDDSTGEVRILGESIWNVWELRHQLGYINMEIDFHFTHGRSGRLTGEETVLTGFSSSELSLDVSEVTPSMRLSAAEALQRCDAESLTNRPLAQLSTGERRRVLLARALVHRPKALILDEPTSGLDMAARRRLLNLLKELAQQGTTLLLVTHHLEEILPNIEHVILLDRGQVSFQGPRSEGLDAQKLSQLFGCQLSIQPDGDGFLSTTIV